MIIVTIVVVGPREPVEIYGLRSKNRCFWLLNRPFQALFDAFFKRFIYYVKMFLWSDPI
jgi:hypothetical protein